MRTIRAVLPSLLAALALSACAGAPSRPASAPGEATLAEGGRIWANTCSRCHTRRPATDYTAQEWPILVSHMRTRADLTRAEAEAVTAYLQDLAGRPPR